MLETTFAGDERLQLGLLLLGLLALRQSLQLVLDLALVRKRPAPDATLEKAYAAARPAIPDPNELKDLTRATGKTIEELNQWFRAARAQERSTVRSAHLGEAVWRFGVLLVSVGIVVMVEQGQMDAVKGQLLRSCLHLHLLGAHMLSFGSMPLQEYLMVSIELFVRLLFISAFNPNISKLVAMTHDSVDLLLELSKIIDSIGFAGFARVIFVLFGAGWMYAKMFIFPIALYSESKIDLNPANATNLVSNPIFPLWVLQAVFDINGAITILSTAKSAFWSTTVADRRENRGDSISSATSLDYESDSSISSNLRDFNEDR